MCRYSCRGKQRTKKKRQFMPRKKRDASRAMQRHPRRATCTTLVIQCIVLQKLSRCFIISTFSRADLQSGGQRRDMLLSRAQVDASANTVKKFVALLAGIAEPGHRYDFGFEVKLACPLVLVARNLRQGHLLGIIAHQLGCVRRQRRARDLSPGVACCVHVKSLGVLAIVAI